ncbi:hypothetical protein KKE26_12805 [bacterium]|nr:hypothetical protein [bacterium]
MLSRGGGILSPAFISMKQDVNMITYIQQLKSFLLKVQKPQVFFLVCICLLLANCATLRLEEIDNSIIREKDGIKIKVEHDYKFEDFTAFKITIQNILAKPIYFNSYDCRIESVSNNATSFVPLSYRKVKEEKSTDSFPSKKDWIDIPAPPDYYFGNVPLYSYQMSKIKSLLFDDGFVIQGKEKSGYIFFQAFKEGDKLKLTIPIEEKINFYFIYEVTSEKKSMIEHFMEDILKEFE